MFALSAGTVVCGKG